MDFRFEWDESKAQQNTEKHGVSFEEASTVFGDPFSRTIFDAEHSVNEERYIDIGRSSQDRMLVVAYTEREDRIRIVSARVATTRERRNYER